MAKKKELKKRIERQQKQIQELNAEIFDLHKDIHILVIEGRASVLYEAVKQRWKMSYGLQTAMWAGNPDFLNADIRFQGLQHLGDGWVSQSNYGRSNSNKPNPERGSLNTSDRMK